MISVQDSLRERLTTLSETNPEGFKNLLMQCREDSKLFAEMFCADIITENLTDEYIKYRLTLVLNAPTKTELYQIRAAYFAIPKVIQV